MTLFSDLLNTSVAHDFLVVEPTTTVQQAITLIAQPCLNNALGQPVSGNKDCLPHDRRSRCLVVGDKGTFIGIVTEQELVNWMAEQVQSTPLNELESFTVERIMNPTIVTLKTVAFKDGAFALKLLERHHARHLLLLDEHDELLGLVTYDSLCRALSPHFFDQATKQEALFADSSSFSPTQEDRENLVAQLANRIRVSLNLSEILESCVQEIRAFLSCDRVLIYQFQPDWSGIIIAESVGKGWRSALGNQIYDSCYQQQSTDLYAKDTPIIVNNIYVENYTPCHVQLLETYQVKANLVVPIRVSGNLWGLLISHQCSDYRQWRREDGSFLRVIGVQLAIAIQQSLTQEKLHEELLARKQVEIQLRQSEQAYAALVSTAPVGIYYTDRQGHCTYVNAPYCSLTGLSLSELKQNCWPEAVHPGDLDRVWRAWNSAIQDQQCFQLEFRFLHSDGSVIWVYSQAVPECDDSGQLTGYIGSLTDISDRKASEQALQESEARHRALLRAVPDLMMRVNRDGMYLEFLASPSFKVVGDLNHWVGKHISAHFPPTVVVKRLNAIHQALATNEVQIYEQELSVDDAIQIEEVRVVPYKTDEVLLLVRDISDRKRAEYQMQSLLKGTAAITGQDFFPVLVEHISETFKVSHTFVAELVDERLQSLAYWANGKLSPQFSYTPVHTPCEIVLEDGQFFCAAAVQAAFPESQNLVEMNADSYLGIALSGTDGSTLGVLCILHSAALTDPQGTENVLRIFAARAAAELERKRAIASLEQLNQKLESKVLERTAALQERETRYRALMEGAGDGILLLSRDGHVLEANPKASELLGYSCHELATMHYSCFHSEKAMHTIMAGFNTMERQKSNHSLQMLDIEFLHPIDGNITVDISASLITINGELMIQEILRDTQARKRLESERKKAQTAIQESEARFRYLADYAPVLIWLANQKKAFTHVNKGWLNFTGRSLESELGEGWTQAIHPHELQICLDTYNDAFEARQPFEMEYRLRRFDNVYRWVLAVGVPRYNANDEFLGYIGSCIDISDRKQSEAQLRQTNAELARATRLKDEFLANMSHELRTPLNAILGMTEGLTEGIFGPINDKQSNALETVERSGRHLLALINDILDVAKIESGQVALDRTPALISGLCHSSLTFVKQQAQKKQIQLITQIPANIPQLWIDERRMLQALINLLNNAVKFTPEGGTVTLNVRSYLAPIKDESVNVTRTDRQALEILPPRGSTPSSESESSESTAPLSMVLSYICIDVIDTGIGISAEHLPCLFQPFVQIDSSLNRQYQGTGLGLALVKNIVELHGGSVSVDSQEGIGSCFTVILPCTLPNVNSVDPLPLSSLNLAEHPDSTQQGPQSVPDQHPTNTSDSASVSCLPLSSHSLVPGKHPSPIFSQQTSRTGAGDSNESLTSDKTDEPATIPLVLLAENNAATINTWSSYLKAKGYHLSVANTEADLIEQIQTICPDVIVINIQMPGMEDVETIHRLRQGPNSQHVPIIIVSDATPSESRERYLGAGVSEYLTKPIQLKQLVTTIQALTNDR